MIDIKKNHDVKIQIKVDTYIYIYKKLYKLVNVYGKSNVRESCEILRRSSCILSSLL